MADISASLSTDTAVPAAPHLEFIERGFMALSVLDPALPAAAARYVTDASHAAVLSDLRVHAPMAGWLLGKPGRLSWGYTLGGYDSGDRKRTALIEAGLRARQHLYQRIDVRPFDLAVLLRMGHVFDAADQGDRLDTAGAKAPAWLQYVLNDALWASLCPSGGHPNERRLMEALPNWDIRLVRALLEEAGLPQWMALSIVFERDGLDAYARDGVYRRLLLAGPLDEDMVCRPEDVELALDDLSTIGKIQLAERIGNVQVLRERFADVLARLAVGDGKELRVAAARHLGGLDPTVRQSHLAKLLGCGNAGERAHAAELLARAQGPAAAQLLESALALETSKPVQHAIRSALSRLRAVVDGAGADLPEPPVAPPLVETVLGDDAFDLLVANREELRDRYRLAAEKEDAENQLRDYKFEFMRSAYRRFLNLGDGQLRDVVRFVNGERIQATRINRDTTDEIMALGGRLEARADFGLLQAMRWERRGHRVDSVLWHGAWLQRWLRRQDLDKVDLRQLAHAAARCGAPANVFAIACVYDAWEGGLDLPQEVLPPDRVWPCLMEYPEAIDAGLGLAAGNDPGLQFASLRPTLSALETFPTMPARWLPRVMELALGDAKSYRLAAQRTLAKVPDIGERVVEALQAGKQELRAEASRWLARLGYLPAIPALYAALDKEKSETVSAELLTSLERLGEDLSPRLAPEVLLAQARKGLKGKAPAGLSWLVLENLPACSWGNKALEDRQVDPEIMRWWVVLAAKLKEPTGNALLKRYVGLLDKDSQAALGRFLLLAFIGHDTARFSTDEVAAWARRQAAARAQVNHYDTEESLFEYYRRVKSLEYKGSAIGEKGILALVFVAPGHELVDALRPYFRDHYQRRAQIEALLDAAAESSDPAVIQFLLGIARRYRTASIQERARALAERVAERNGWTQEQLADRTVPTGGLDDTGVLRLQYGEREFEVTLDEGLRPILRNADGKVLAALPAARQHDAADAIKEARQLFAACKKEVKQVIEIQSVRLHEAMCANRTWAAGEWDEYLRRHPIVGRLAQRLVWIQHSGDDGEPVAFRPTEDGSLIDAGDNEVQLDQDAHVALAHAVLLGDEATLAWLAHLENYKIAPLFAQLSRRLPQAGTYSSDEIADRRGWVSDTFTLRGELGKLGYQRAPAQDGGFFSEYTKDFVSVGIQVCVGFSGNVLPEENLPAALTALSFRRLGGRRRRWHPAGRGSVVLTEVPQVLLAEAYGDYHAVAEACTGFDPDWENKMPW